MELPLFGKKFNINEFGGSFNGNCWVVSFSGRWGTGLDSKETCKELIFKNGGGLQILAYRVGA